MVRRFRIQVQRYVRQQHLQGALRRRVRFPSSKDRLRAAMLLSRKKCGPKAVDCRPVPLIAVSEATNPVLGRGMDAHNVVPNFR